MRCIALLMAGLAACAPVTQSSAQPTYLGVQTDLLDGDLVNFRVALRGTDDPALVENYAECAAAQYALIRGQAFTRLVRVNTSKEGGTWRSDAVYTISPDLPRGRASIDAVVKVADCGASGIPTV